MKAATQDLGSPLTPWEQAQISALGGHLLACQNKPDPRRGVVLRGLHLNSLG